MVGTVGLLGLAAVEGVRRITADAAFASSGTYDIADLAQRRGWDEIPEMVIRGTGTVGYLVLATAGLAVIGVVVLLRSPPVGPWVFLQAVAVVVVAGWFLTGVQRADAYLHGRYIEVIGSRAGFAGNHRARENACSLGGAGDGRRHSRLGGLGCLGRAR